MTTFDPSALIEAARRIRAQAYAPYSKFPVGAALLDDAGRVHLGVNVENSAFPHGQCAERSALGAAVTAGARRFTALAVVTALDPAGEPGAPCGGCRQSLAEFGLTTVVILAGPEGERFVATSVGELLPRAFSGANL